jgi:hypothetical protein
MNISLEQVTILRQWFDSLQDTHQEYLEQKDYALAAELYELCGMRLPDSVKNPLTRPVVRRSETPSTLQADYSAER